MSDIQAHLDADIAELSAHLTAIEAEVADLKAKAAAAGAPLDFTRLDALVANAKAADPTAAATAPAGTTVPPVTGPAGATVAADGTPLPAPGPSDATAPSATAPSASAPITAPAPADDAAEDTAAGVADAATTADVPASTGNVTLPVYTYDGDPTTIDGTSWTAAHEATADGHPLYHFAHDEAGQPPAGDGLGGVWHLYTGPTQPAA